jgi:hypothetical protein
MSLSIGKAFAAFGVVSLLCLGLQRAHAEEASKDKFPPRYQHSLDLIDERRCQEAWDELWKFAQARDYYALYLLAGSVFGHPFRFTGAADVETLVKVYLPMEIYATLTPEMINSPFSIETIHRSLIPSTLVHSRDLDRSASKIVIDCFESTESAEVCVRLAIERRVIPDYDAYIATVNLINKTSLHVECETALGIPKEFRIPKQ